METQLSKIMDMKEKAVVRGKWTETGLHQETRKSQINNLLTLHLKKLRKEEQPKPRVSRRKKHRLHSRNKN